MMGTEKPGNTPLCALSAVLRGGKDTAVPSSPMLGVFPGNPFCFPNYTLVFLSTYYFCSGVTAILYGPL